MPTPEPIDRAELERLVERLRLLALDCLGHHAFASGEPDITAAADAIEALMTQPADRVEAVARALDGLPAYGFDGGKWDALPDAHTILAASGIAALEARVKALASENTALTNTINGVETSLGAILDDVVKLHRDVIRARAALGADNADTC